ncbi:hypothetical protein WDZ55_17920 [Pseudomonas bubulae]|uniref:hypothetical protein n=1 Tax=Pseudomonas bubulae TaxID=2316085 RepID=UPI001C4F8801|nr:hypothetical protein [Pseudomonas bubulae]
MLEKLDSDDIKFAERYLRETNPGFLYHYLSGKGYTYATLALGVAEQNTVAGIVALNYMKEVVAAQGMPIDENKIQEILRSMASEYLNVLKSQIEGDQLEVVRDINYQEVWKFHSDVFVSAGYSADAWTLNSVFTVLPEENRQDYWQRVLGSAGDTKAELELAAETYALMHIMALSASSEGRQMAARWIRRIESIENSGASVKLGSAKLVKFFDASVTQIKEYIFGKPVVPYYPAPAPTSPPPKIVMPLPPVQMPTQPPARRRRRRGGGGRPPTTAAGYDNGGHYSGGGGRLRIDP